VTVAFGFENKAVCVSGLGFPLGRHCISLVKGTTVCLSCCELAVINGNCVKAASASTWNNTDWTVLHKKEGRKTRKRLKNKK
jgi:hypothetical protein